MSDLEDVYAGKTPADEVQTEQAEQVTATGEQTSVPPTQETETAPPEVDWRAEAEKHRKTAEEADRKARGLEQALAATRQKVREQPAPNFTEDPKAFVENLREQFQQDITLLRVENAQNSARAKYADYDEKEQVFVGLVQQIPYLAAQIQQSPNPAEFAYQTAKFHMEVQAAGGSVDALKAKLTADIEAERKAKYAVQTANLPKTLSGATGTGRTSSQVFTGPAPLESIYAKKGR